MNNPKQSTPSNDLENEILNPSIPKNEREWWAYREIEKLRGCIKSINDQWKIQGQNGNWNSSEYVLGLYNGLEFSLATLENRPANLKSSQDSEFLRYQKLKQL